MVEVNFRSEIDGKKAWRIIQEIISDKMGGWASLPWRRDNMEIARIREAVARIREDSEVLVCIGVGGSYLGHRAIIEALRPESGVEIIYAGNSLSQRELNAAMKQLGDRDFSINVISKSGTTLEPAWAFEVFKRKLIEKYGAEGAAQRIYATTDAAKGALHDEAVENNYTRFVVPDNVGGRYSVLTAVGLLPMAVAGVDIEAVLEGAREESAEFFAEKTEVEAIKQNAAVQYAFMRQDLAKKGYETEVFATFEPSTTYFNEWLKQLFGESEGKGGRGILPTSVAYTTDLHSMGQYMQDGRRDLFETIINYPTDKTNGMVVAAVQKAHRSGGIPVLMVNPNSFNAKGFGGLIYFFEMTCAISAKLSGVNPFDQPGVEVYKAELRRLMDNA